MRSVHLSKGFIAISEGESVENAATKQKGCDDFKT
jgi:hypothetical protein